MATLDHSIRDLILAHLKRTGLSGRRFGDEVLGDPGFIASLKRGRGMGLKTADKVLAAMGQPSIGPAFLREVEAFLEAGGNKPYVFGEQAAGDASFVDRLQDGVSFYLVTVDRVRAWMAAHADEACLAAMRRAVADVPLLAQGCEPRGETGMDKDEGPHLSARQAAAWLGISARSLYRLRKKELGPDHYVFGCRILYRKGALERWAAEHLVRSARGGGKKAVCKWRSGRAKNTVDAVFCLAAATAGLGLVGVDPAMATGGTAVSGALAKATDMVAGTGGQAGAVLAAGMALLCSACLLRSVLGLDAKQLLGAALARVSAGTESLVRRRLVIALHGHFGVRGWLEAEERDAPTGFGSSAGAGP